MKIAFKHDRKIGKSKGGGSVLLLGAIAGGIFLVFGSGGHSGAEAAAEDLGEQYTQLTFVQKLLLGIGWYDPEDVFDMPGSTNAVSGVPIGRS